MNGENISFDDNSFKYKSRSILSQPESPAMVRMLVTHRIVKTENQAVGVMMGIIIVMLVAAGFVIANAFFTAPSSEVPPVAKPEAYVL